VACRHYISIHRNSFPAVLLQTALTWRRTTVRRRGQNRQKLLNSKIFSK
jgi:hypothetical protein